MRPSPVASVVLACALVATMLAPASAASPTVRFEMVSAQACLSDAKAVVTIYPRGQVEVMTVQVSGLPPNTDFDFFVIQAPTAPFGMSWYQGDIKTGSTGRGFQRFIGRFSSGTFVVAPGSLPAPVLHPADASSNLATAPVHMLHLGLWFDSPTDAGNASCPTGTTPFNDTHTAGVQVLNTSNFPALAGPLGQVP